MPDPRIKQFLKRTTNGVIADLSLRHAIFLERLKAHQVNEIIRFLNTDVFPDIMTKSYATIEEILRMGWSPATIPSWAMKPHLKELAESNYALLQAAMRKVRVGYMDDLREVMLAEAEWQAKTMRVGIPKIFQIDIVTPAPTTLNRLVNKTVFQGASLRKMFGALERSAFQRIQQHLSIPAIRRGIRLGIVEGEGIDEMVRRIVGPIKGTRRKGYRGSALQTVRRHTEYTVRTATAQIVSDARRAVAVANKDVVKGFLITATLDAVTTDICMSVDGRELSVDVSGAHLPPYHGRCRTTYTLILKSWKELGISAKEPRPGKRFAREYNDAKKMMTSTPPATLKGPEWWDRQPKWVKLETLGPGKLKVFERGVVDWDDMRTAIISNSYRPLTLKQMIALEQTLL